MTRRLVAFGLNVPPSVDDSVILTDPTQVDALCGFLEEAAAGKELSLIYRGTRDGMNPNSFHQKCDNQGPTVTVVRTTAGYIFGGYADKPWTSDADWTASDKAFLFGLKCYAGQEEPVKMNLKGCQNSYALYHHASFGPTFGSGNDLCLFSRSPPQSSSALGHTYNTPAGSGSKYNLSGGSNFALADVEVFKVQDSSAAKKSYPIGASPRDDMLESLAFDEFQKSIQMCFQAEKTALQDAAMELAALQDTFGKEQTAIQVLCGGNANEIAFLNVSGRVMAVKHSTLQNYPDSVLFKQFVDPNWNKPSKRSSPREWTSKEVVVWIKSIQGLSSDVSLHYRDVSGAELLSLEREDIRNLGIERPGTVALLVKAIQKLRTEEEENSATFIEHSDYCIGKNLDYMRLKAMEALDIPAPGPPEIREPDKKRFKSIVNYYFPGKEAADEFLA
jgi:hypothetical protein